MKNKVINITMDILYLFIGVVTSIVSIKFSYQFFIYNGHEKIWSMLIAVTYVLFLNLTFESGISNFVRAKRLKDEKAKHKSNKVTQDNFDKIINNRLFKGYVVLFLWLVLVFYSIISTVGGQYELLSELNIDNETTIINNKQGPIIKEKISLLESQMTSYNEEIESLKERLESITGVKDNANYRTTINNIQKRIDSKQVLSEQKADNILKLKDELSIIEQNKSSIKKGNTYDYFESIIKIPAFVIQFVLSFFPSIVIDFFAPISFAMFLFRKKMK